MSEPVHTADPVEDIGGGVTIERRYVDGVLEGIEHTHDCPAGFHMGFIPVMIDPSALVSERPLTIAPVISCPRCEHRGFIREGRWVPVRDADPG